MKLTIIGAAGVRTPMIVKEIIHRQEQLGITTLNLMDIDIENLNLIGSVTRSLEASGKAKFDIERSADPIKALDGADYVITTFRVGGPASRIIDEKVPLELGYLGQETTGAGGFAMGLRSIPVLLDYIKTMEKVCPDAWLINFANPSGMLTEAIHHTAGWHKAVGICDGPSSMLHLIASLMKLPADALAMEYFGLNHLGWIRSIHDSTHEYLPDITRMFVAAGGFPGYRIEPDLVADLGLIPNEYLYYYYYQKRSVQEILKAKQTRGELVAELNGQLFDSLKEVQKYNDIEQITRVYEDYIRSRSETYLSHSGDNKPKINEISIPSDGMDLGYANLALDLIESLNDGPARQLILNVPNQGSITGMSDDDVVEIPVMVSKNKLQAVNIGLVPDHCLGLMKSVKAYESLTIQAAVEKNYRKALTALSLHPLVHDRPSAKLILDGYLSRHGSYFPRLN